MPQGPLCATGTQAVPQGPHLCHRDPNCATGTPPIPQGPQLCHRKNGCATGTLAVPQGPQVCQRDPGVLQALQLCHRDPSCITDTPAVPQGPCCEGSQDNQSPLCGTWLHTGTGRHLVLCSVLQAAHWQLCAVISSTKGKTPWDGAEVCCAAQNTALQEG